MTKGQIASVCIKKDAELSVILVKILLSDLIPEKFAILELSKKDIQTLHQAVLDSQI